MNKSLAIAAVVLVGLLLAGGAFWFIRGLNQPPPGEEAEEEVLRQLSQEELPYVALIPGGSCEYTISIDNIVDAATLEYEITYTNAEGVLQGVPGSIPDPGKSEERDVLFGSESSGHRRCDPGVEQGNITLRYRNEKGQLAAKVETDFHIQEETDELVSGDGRFSLTLSREASSKFVTMNTLGLPSQAPGSLVFGPYAVFSNGSSKVSAEVDLGGEGTLYLWDGGEWIELPDSETSLLGVFIRAD